jgi:hypothetical protein
MKNKLYCFLYILMIFLLLCCPGVSLYPRLNLATKLTKDTKDTKELLDREYVSKGYIHKIFFDIFDHS